MELIEAALAFAITMLVLSLTCSSFVEIVHRVFLMREAGLKHMLYRLYDQVIVTYVRPGLEAEAKQKGLAGSSLAAVVDNLVESGRKAFVDRMTANRAPMGVTPKATPTTPAKDVPDKPKWAFSLWGGRDLSAMTAAQFMERLGTIDIGKDIADMNKAANDIAANAGGAAADALDAVLKDIAQKFDALGKEASTYFEGRARLLSVIVAIVLAFAIRVDAVELFNTYLRDPSARNQVIEQTKTVTAQYQAAAEVLKSVDTKTEDGKKQVEALQADLQSAIKETRATAKRFADLGLPIGWSKQNATLDPGEDVCLVNGAIHVLAKDEPCENKQKLGVWNVAKLLCSLLLGGLLIGLGAPFWYNTVTGLTNIRSIMKDLTGGGDPTPPVAGTQAAALQTGATPPTPDRAQPSTPVGAFNVSRAAQAAVEAAKAKAEAEAAKAKT